MNLKAVAAGLALASMAASSFAVDYSVSLSSGSVSFGRSNITEASFTDTINFTGVTAGTYSFQSSITSFDGVTFSAVDLNGFAFTILNSTPGLSVAYGTSTSDSWEMTITGTGDGFASYGGQISLLAATPVPEPESYALMLAGVGAVGFLIRRRRETA